MSKIKWPFGAGDTKAMSATGAQAITIDNELTVIDGVAVEATGARTINLTIDDEIGVGAKLIVKSKSNAAENMVFGTSITGPTVAGVAGKTFVFTFVYDGTAFIQEGLSVQLD